MTLRRCLAHRYSSRTAAVTANSALRYTIIEAADYMETSPLGRSEWIKFYGLLYGSEKATSLFSGIEKSYLHLKAFAAKLPLGYSILTERKTGSVWYVSGGCSTIGTLLQDAHARYLFADDTHSGSLPMSPEQILAKADEVDVWATKYWGDHPLSRAELLQEYPGYSQLKAMKTGRVFQAKYQFAALFRADQFSSRAPASRVYHPLASRDHPFVGSVEVLFATIDISSQL